MDDQVYISTPDQRILIGSRHDVVEAGKQIAKLTGGSSGGGAWSLVFGAMDAEPDKHFHDVEGIQQLANEAADLRRTLGHDLPATGQAFLDRLAALG